MNGVAGVLALMTGWLVRRYSEYRLLIMTSVISLVTITIIPVFTGLMPLFLVSGVRGLALAISVVILVSMVARSVGGAHQGKAMGLRMTCHQAINVVTPVVMGAIIQWSGLHAAFYIVGLSALALNLWVGWAGRKAIVPQ